MSRGAFPETFKSLDSPADSDRTRLGDAEDGCRPTEYSLGVSLKGDIHALQRQSLNVCLTLAQNRYLLNSEQGNEGYLNIRVREKEYNDIMSKAGERGCPFGSPISLRRG